MKRKLRRNLPRRGSVCMAINESILNKIEKLEITEEEKELLRELLQYQEHAGYQYKNQYMEIIKGYLESKK